MQEYASTDALPQQKRPTFRTYSKRNFDKISQIQHLSGKDRFAMRVVAQVLPFRVNQYVIDHLIAWDDVPNDPIYRLVFPQREMLEERHFDRIASLLRSDAQQDVVDTAVDEIHREMNPHPAGQTTLNVPRIGNELVHGLSISTERRCCSFPAKGKLVIRIARSVFGGLNSLQETRCAFRHERCRLCTSISKVTKK